MMNSIIFIAQAPAQPHPIVSMLPLILMFAIFYFLLIRPQQKKQKVHRDFVQNLQKNQEVITLGGMHGTIVNLKEKTVILRISENARVEFDKNSISHLKDK
jgi:preprotein translocase subunit YajC